MLQSQSKRNFTVVLISTMSFSLTIAMVELVRSGQELVLNYECQL
jgi:hypothetical protein